MTAAEFRDIRLYRLGFTMVEAAVMSDCDELAVKAGLHYPGDLIRDHTVADPLSRGLDQVAAP